MEIGAGIGNLSVHLMPRSTYWTTDVNPYYLHYLTTLSYGRPYMFVAYADALNAASLPSTQAFDTVICLNVIEHLQDDIAALRNIWNVVEEGGRADRVGSVRARFVWAPLDEVLGHFRRYTGEQLCSAATQAGFRVEQLVKFNRIGTIAWWLNGRVLRKKTFGLVQIRVLNILTPIFRLVDSWLPLPPLSIIAVLRKDRGFRFARTPLNANATGRRWEVSTVGPERFLIPICANCSAR